MSKRKKIVEVGGPIKPAEVDYVFTEAYNAFKESGAERSVIEIRFTDGSRAKVKYYRRSAIGMLSGLVFLVIPALKEHYDIYKELSQTVDLHQLTEYFYKITNLLT